MSEARDAAALAPLSMEQLASLLAKVDATLAEGRALREKIVRAMEERRSPAWPHSHSASASPPHR